MTGLSVEQFDALVELVTQALDKPWQAAVGRPRELDLGEAVFVTLVYARHNVTQELLAAAGDVIADKGFQGSGYITPVKKPAGGELTWLQHDYNNKLSGLRAAIERAVAHIKNWVTIQGAA